MIDELEHKEAAHIEDSEKHLKDILYEAADGFSSKEQEDELTQVCDQAEPTIILMIYIKIRLGVC